MVSPTLKHAKVLAQADGPDSSLVLPSNWNADHEFKYNTSPFYDEGTWTPVLTCVNPGTLARTYSDQWGNWARVGRIVTIQFYISIASFTLGTATGALRVTGLPFTSIDNGWSPLAGSHNGVDFAGAIAGAMVETGSTHVRFLSSTDNAAWADTLIQNAGIVAGDSMIFGGSYQAVVP